MITSRDNDLEGVISNDCILIESPTKIWNKDKIWISGYACKSADPSSMSFSKYSENWAENIEAYFNSREWFKQNFPNTFEYIDDLINFYEKDGHIGNFINRYGIKIRNIQDMLPNWDIANYEIIEDIEDMVSKKSHLTQKEKIALYDLYKLKAQKGILPEEYKKEYQKLLSKKRFNQLYSLKSKQGGLNRRNTKDYIREYFNLKNIGYTPPYSKLDVFKDINLDYILHDDNKFVLDDLYNGNYIIKLRYKLKLLLGD